MVKVLFVGNFLSRTHGSLPVSEGIAKRLNSEGIVTRMVSSFQNRLLRFAEIVVSVAFGRYTVLHIDVFSGNSFLFARVAAEVGRCRGKKIILTLRGGALHEHYQGREVVFKKLFKNAYVQSPSLFLKDFFEHQQLAVAYNPNPVELKNFPYNRDQVKPKSLLWVRAFSEIYNPDIPVKILHHILQEFPDATLTMIGPDKGLLNQTIKLLEELKIKDKVNLLGPVSNDQLHTYYQSHAVYLNTTSYESFGVAVVEAASCGVPVVSFRVGEIPYLWTDEENILLCDQGDVEAMARQVKRILQDSALRDRLSTNARQRAEEFSWQRVKSQWIELVTT